jgi:hypothetical protein
VVVIRGIPQNGAWILSADDDPLFFRRLCGGQIGSWTCWTRRVPDGGDWQVVRIEFPWQRVLGSPAAGIAVRSQESGVRSQNENDVNGRPSRKDFRRWV